MKYYFNELDSIFNLPLAVASNKSYDDLDYETKINEQKLKDIFCKIDEWLHNKAATITEIANDYENKINEMKNYYDKQIFALKETIDKTANIEGDWFKVRKQNDINNYIWDKMIMLIDNSYIKYYQKNASWYGSEAYRDDDAVKYPEIDKLNFWTLLADKYYDDNKYLSDLVPSLQQEKTNWIEERSLPYVDNAIRRNDLMKGIFNDLAHVENSSEAFHKNFEELIGYIDANIEGKII